MRKMAVVAIVVTILGALGGGMKAYGSGSCYNMSGVVQGCGLNRNVLMICGFSIPWGINFQFCTMQAPYSNFPTCVSGQKNGYWNEGDSFLFFCSFTAKGTCCGGGVTSLTAFDSYSTTNCENSGCQETTING